MEDEARIRLCCKSNSYQMVLMSADRELSLPHRDSPDLLDTAISFYYE